MSREFLQISFLIFLVGAVTSARAVRDLARETDSLVAQTHALSLTAKIELRNASSRIAEAPFKCQGRLTVSSGTAVPTSDVSNASTLYFTPYQGNTLALYDGTNWNFSTFTERSLALSSLTAGTNYDVFIYNNSGTLTLELTAWSTATARATSLVLQDGVLVKSGASTRRYLGTIRTTATNQTQDTGTQRFVWNFYHRARRSFATSETTDSWAYGTATFRATNGNSNNKIEYVTGMNDVMVNLRGLVMVTATATLRQNLSTTFGLDSTTTPMTNALRGGSGRDTIRHQLWTEVGETNNGLGYHAIQWIEYGGTAETWYGDDAGDARVQAGILGWMHG